MADSLQLLRMLEPVVRPGAGAGAVPGAIPGAGAGAKAPQLPVEQRDFDSLLSEWSQQSPAALPGSGAAGAVKPAGEAGAAPANPLDGLGRIENASLHRLLAAQRATR